MDIERVFSSKTSIGEGPAEKTMTDTRQATKECAKPSAARHLKIKTGAMGWPADSQESKRAAAVDTETDKAIYGHQHYVATPAGKQSEFV